MKKILITLVLLSFTLKLSADETIATEQNSKSIDLDNISTQGLDENVIAVFAQTRAIIMQARKDADTELEFSASKEWCLLLHNFDFLEQAKDCYYTIGTDAKTEAKWPYLYGKAALEQGNMQDAEKGLIEALIRDINYLPAHYYLIKSAFEQGNIRAAFNLKSQLPVELQLNSIILELYGDLYYEVENHYVAIGYYQQALHLVAKAKRINYKIGRAYLALGEETLAQQYINNSNQVGIKLTDPYYQEVKNTTVGEIPYLIKGKAALVHGDNKLAIEAYNKALAYNPESQTARLNSAVAYFRDQQLQKAKSLFSEILASNPSQTTALYNLAIIAQADNELLKAIDYLQQYNAIIENDAEVNSQLAQLYYRSRDYQKCIDICQLEIFNGNEKIQLLKAKSLVQLGHYAQATELLKEIHKHKADNREVLLLLAKLLSQGPDLSLRDAQQSLAYAKKAVEIKKDPLSYWQLIMAQDEAKQCTELLSTIEAFSAELKIQAQQTYLKLSQQRGDDLKCVGLIDEP